MVDNTVYIQNYLGKYLYEIQNSAEQQKYTNCGIEEFLQQRFKVQHNKTRMIINDALPGLSIIACGNEIEVSKQLYDHENITVSNSLELTDFSKNPRGEYNPNIISTMAYLICNNQTTFNIEGDIDEPIYVKYKTDYESFYNSILCFNIENSLNIEIIEEIESVAALNVVTNYSLYPNSILNLYSLYKNSIPGISFIYRNMNLFGSSTYNHKVLGKGSSNIVDETTLSMYDRTNSEILGLIDSMGRNFHSILNIEPRGIDYNYDIEHKYVLYGDSNIRFYPTVSGIFDLENITIDRLLVNKKTDKFFKTSIQDFTKDILDRFVLERTMDVKRFYDYKSTFLNLQ